MKALINFKICDNARECSGIAACPTGAMHYDEEKETIVVDEEKCTCCGICEAECPIGAIMVAQDEDQYKQYQKDIENDPRTIKDLFVDRYGAVSLSSFFKIEDTDIDSKINTSSLVLIEMYTEDEARCLLKSIPIKDITEEMSNISYYKYEPNDEVMQKYDVTILPSLLIFKNGKLLGKVEDYYEIDQLDDLKNKILKIINK